MKSTHRRSSSENVTQEHFSTNCINKNGDNLKIDDNHDYIIQANNNNIINFNTHPNCNTDDVDENDNFLLHKDSKKEYSPDDISDPFIRKFGSDGKVQTSGGRPISDQGWNGQARAKPKGDQRRDSESELPVGFEAVLMELGSPGKFFCFQFFLHNLCTFCVSNTVLIYVFTAFEPPHTCKQLLNESELLSQYDLLNSSHSQVHYGTCNITISRNVSGHAETVATFGCLQGHDYSRSKYISFVAEWDLVCDNVGLKELVLTVMMVGQTLGGVIFTSIGDQFGRKPVLVVSNFLLCASGLGAAYSSSIYLLLACRFLAGFFQQGTALLSYTTVMESLTAKYRRVAGVLSGTMWTVSMLILGLMAYLMKEGSWRTFQMAAALFACNVLLYPFLLCESPRWLIANKKYDKALAIVKQACRMNGKDYLQVKELFDKQVVRVEEIREDQKIAAHAVRTGNVEHYSLLDILRHRSLLVSSLIMFFIWITNSSTYYALYLTSSALAGDRHLNFVLMGLADLPADLVNLALFAYFGRKPVIMGWLLTAGSGLFLATLLMSFGTTGLTRILTTVFSLIAKFGIGASFNSIFMYTPELFPTNLRSAGLGVCSSVSRLGGMVAPYSQFLADVVLWGPGCIFSAMCFVSALLFMKLPETRGQPMPSTIRDMKERATRQKFRKMAAIETDFELQTLT